MKRSLLILVFMTCLSSITNAQVLTKIDKVTSFQEGLGAVEKDNTWGFIDSDGTLIIDYRKDIVAISGEYPAFNNGLCIIQEVRDGITFYGYINKKGEKVIPAEYIAATPFKNGHARVIKYYKAKTNTTNALGKTIVNYSYNELVIDTKNQKIQHLRGPHTLLFEKLKLEQNKPTITSKFISDKLIAVKEKDDTYTIYKLDE